MSNTDRIRARPVEQDALLNFGGYDEAIPLADLGLDRSGPRMPDGASGGFARPNLNLAGNRSPSQPGGGAPEVSLAQFFAPASQSPTNSTPFHTSSSPVLYQNVSEAQSQFGQGSSHISNRVSLTPVSKASRDRTNAQIFKGLNPGTASNSRLQMQQQVAGTQRLLMQQMADQEALEAEFQQSQVELAKLLAAESVEREQQLASEQYQRQLALEQESKHEQAFNALKAERLERERVREN